MLMDFTWAADGAAQATGATRRQRERRLRMSVAMALAEANHHSAPRRQTTARAEATNKDLPWTPTSSRCSRTSWRGRGLTASLASSRRTGYSGTVEQIIEIFVPVPILDDPVPLMEDQLVEILTVAFMSNNFVESIDVPKIIFEDPTPQRKVLSEPQQLVDHVMDVPVPQSVSLARWCDAVGNLWHKVVMRRGGGYRWRAGTRHVQSPECTTRV